MEEETPVGEYFDEKDKNAAAYGVEDMRLWSQWHEEGRKKKHLKPLLTRFGPTINKKTNELSSLGVNQAALKSNLTRHTIKAFEDYDPDHPSKATLHTHVTNKLRKGIRYIKKYQNMGGIPELKSNLIGHVQRAQDELQTDSARTIAKHMRGIEDAPKYVRTVTTRMVSEVMRAAAVKDVVGSTFESDPVPQMANRLGEVTDMLRPALKPHDQPVFDYMYGQYQQQNLRPGQIAKKLDRSASSISRSSKRIKTEINKYL